MSYEWYTWIVLVYVIFLLLISFVNIIKIINNGGLQLDSTLAFLLLIVGSIMSIISIINFDALVKKQKSSPGLSEDEKKRYMPLFAASTVVFLLMTSFITSIFIFKK
jgi:hypothetical protein